MGTGREAVRHTGRDERAEAVLPQGDSSCEQGALCAEAVILPPKEEVELLGWEEDAHPSPRDCEFSDKGAISVCTVESYFGDLRVPGIGLGSVSPLGSGTFSFPHTVIIFPGTAQRLHCGASMTAG